MKSFHKNIIGRFFRVAHQMFVSVVLDAFTLEGNCFLRTPNEYATTSFEIRTRAIRENVVFPEAGPEFQFKKKEYVEKYGPYSMKYFENIMKELLNNFEASEKMPFKQRTIRKVWVLKQLYELFDGSMGLLVLGKPHLLGVAIAKALEVLRDSTIEMIMDDRAHSEVTKNSIAKSLKIIQKIYTNIANIVTSDMKLLKLLPTTTLLALVEYASHKMVSKIRRLSWIDPVLVNRVTPKFNSYWQNFWHKFFARNFNLSNDICFVIAEFMPMIFKKEAFLDFFRRKYDTRTREFFGKRLFDVEEINNTVKIIIN